MKEIKRTKRRLAVIPTSFLDRHRGGNVFFFFLILLLSSLLFPQSHRLTFTQQPAASPSVHDFHIVHVGKLQPGCCGRDKRSPLASSCEMPDLSLSSLLLLSPVGFAKQNKKKNTERGSLFSLVGLLSSCRNASTGYADDCGRA